MPLRIFSLLLFILGGAQSAMINAAQIELNVADIASPAFSAKSVRVTLLQKGSADLHIAEMSIAEKKWQDVHLHCAEFSFSTAKVLCSRGKLDAAPDLPFSVSYEYDTQKLELLLLAGAELWQLHADFKARPWRISALLRNAQAYRLAALFTNDFPLPTKGTLDGVLELRGSDQGLRSANAALALTDVSFSDSSGLRAGEKFRVKLNLDATRADQQWDSRIRLDWRSGELFWQPLYLKGGHSLQADVHWDGKQLDIAQAQVNLDGVGTVEVSALWDVSAKQLLEAGISGNKLALARIFSDYAKPFLTGGMLAESEMSGTADLNLKFSKGATQEESRLSLHDASFVDVQKRFALYGLNADIPWHPEQATTAHVSYSSGALWGVALGAAELKMNMRGLDFAIPDASLPILDGKLSVHDFHLYHERGEWCWVFSGGLTPISMPSLSLALGWPEMQGTLSGMIPQVSYRAKMLKLDGALLFRVFNGSVVVSRLKLFDPFGRAPRLYGNVDMRELDLGALTQAFSFGNVQGLIDVGVKELELVNWQPVHFDARVASSLGSYRKKISQKAVQNISALGGAGAAAAVQRSVMSVFENFGYERIALSCALHNGICLMDGAGASADGYYIVKGGGIPAINVMGYNHKVDWDELLTRLKRVINSNKKALIE